METKIKENALFNPEGDTETRLRKMIGGNTTNLNDFNNMRYKWVSDWYRQAMNNFWIPEEINLTQDTKDYPHLTPAERTAYDKILSFLVFLDSLQVTISRHSANTSRQTKSTSACIFKHFKGVYTARATAICSTLSVVRRNAMTFCINGKQTNIC